LGFVVGSISGEYNKHDQARKTVMPI
jgi:hypothetical protein